MQTAALLALTLCAESGSASEFVAPYVQTVKEDVQLILDLAQVDSSDYVIDLGSGDGRFVIEAAKRGATAQGVELNPELVALARGAAQDAGVAEHTLFVQGDIFSVDISQASVVILYLFPEANIKLRPKLLTELTPGTRVVSNSFHMGSWMPDGKAQGRTSGGALLWVIPADVQGLWTLKFAEETLNLKLHQKFQKVDAWSVSSDKALTLSTFQLAGTTCQFVGSSHRGSYLFEGQINGNKITGTATLQDDSRTEVLRWEANRLEQPSQSASADEA